MIQIQIQTPIVTVATVGEATGGTQ